jgi:hypothetical protein
MEISTQGIDLNDSLRNIGHDSTAVFDESPSNPTEWACSENLRAASKPEDDEDEDEDLDDEEEDDEGDEEEDEEEDEDDEGDEEEDEEEEDDDEDEDEEEDDDELKVTRLR